MGKKKKKKDEIIIPDSELIIPPEAIIHRKGTEFVQGQEAVDKFVDNKNKAKQAKACEDNKAIIFSQLDLLKSRCLSDAQRIDAEKDDMIQLALYHIIGNHWDKETNEVKARRVKKLFSWLKDIKVHPLTKNFDARRKFNIFVFYGDHHLEYFKDPKFREPVQLIWWRYPEPVPIFDKKEELVTGFINNWELLVEVDVT